MKIFSACQKPQKAGGGRFFDHWQQEDNMEKWAKIIVKFL